MAKSRNSGVTAPASNSQNGNGWQDAFMPGHNFGDPSRLHRWQSAIGPGDRAAWRSWVAQQGVQVTDDEETQITKRDSAASLRTGDPTKAYGYLKTKNSMEINKKFYDPNNAGKSITKLFTRADDRKTVKTLDKLIANNTTKADALFTRYLNPYGQGHTLNDTLQKTYGLTTQQVQTLLSVPNMTKSQLAAFSKSMKGLTSYNPAYSSTSANRTANVFQNFPIMRSIRVPAGTHAYIARNNPAESEVLFGRGMETRVIGISTETINGRTHVVLEEELVGFR